VAANGNSKVSYVTQGNTAASNISNKILVAEHFWSGLNAALLHLRHPSAFTLPYTSLPTSPISNRLFSNVATSNNLIVPKYAHKFSKVTYFYKHEISNTFQRQITIHREM